MWSKTSLSPLPSSGGLHRCCTKSQHLVRSHRSLIPASRFRVSGQKAGSLFWLGLLLPSLGNQKLSRKNIPESAWSGKIDCSSPRQNWDLDFWKERAWSALCMVFGGMHMSTRAIQVPVLQPKPSNAALPCHEKQQRLHFVTNLVGFAHGYEEPSQYNRRRRIFVGSSCNRVGGSLGRSLPRLEYFGVIQASS